MERTGINKVPILKIKLFIHTFAMNLKMIVCDELNEFSWLLRGIIFICTIYVV